MTDLPTTPSFRLDGRRALVTGASSGIGQGCAAALAEAGAHVVCVARGAEKLEATVAALAERGFSAEARAMDMTDTGALDTAFAGAAYDVVVNAAGMTRPKPAVRMTEEDYDTVMNVNLRAAYFLSTHAARAMMAQGRGGSIIHISSQMGHVGGPDRSVYCASKFGLEGMVKAMAIEWGPAGIRINTVAPTYIRTPLAGPTLADPARRAAIESKIKLGRVGAVEDIMGAVLYLASEASALVTGTSLVVDGGWTAE